VRLLAAVALALVTLALPMTGATYTGGTSAVAASAGPYTGVGTGLLDRYRHVQNSSFTSDSKDVYRGRFTYTFRIDENGNVEGRGDGVYLTATWRLDGVHHGVGAFGCDVPMRTTRFTARVTGRATEETIRIRFALEGAREANDDYDCGARFTGYASDAPRLADSLELVQPAGGIETARARPSIPPLSRLEVTGDRSDSRVNLHEWTITIRAPGEPPEPPGPGARGGGGGPTNPGGACTITGTPGNDTLVGTSRRDVICGLGGNDVIRGAGGNDSLRGDAGNDRLVAGGGDDTLDGGTGADALLGQDGRDLLLGRDRARDTLDGGRHVDWAARDRGVDQVRNVEVVG
jgi:hypothetical protein